MNNTPPCLNEAPWKTEPYFKVFYSHGLLCYMKRHPSMGHWCGYVVSPKELETDGDYPDVDVHGGVTYYGYDNDVCGWVVGFDCAHSGDLVPQIHERLPRPSCLPQDEYRDMNYVREQCEWMAEQVSGMQE